MTNDALMKGLLLTVMLIGLSSGTAFSSHQLGHTDNDDRLTNREPQIPFLLSPITPNAYGPGLNSDGTGRPFIWRPQGENGPLFDPLLKVKPDAYGPGIGMDQYGRPVYPACPPGMTLC
jgi:hypothetical protein